MGDVIGLPLREQERYVKRPELARLLGVSESTVKRWMRAGLPSEKWGGARRFLPSRCVAWVRSQQGRDAA